MQSDWGSTTCQRPCSQEMELGFKAWSSWGQSLVCLWHAILTVSRTHPHHSILWVNGLHQHVWPISISYVTRWITVPLRYSIRSEFSLFVHPDPWKWERTIKAYMPLSEKTELAADSQVKGRCLAFCTVCCKASIQYTHSGGPFLPSPPLNA